MVETFIKKPWLHPVVKRVMPKPGGPVYAYMHVHAHTLAQLQMLDSTT